jgi:Mg2+/citrate symporter
VKKEDLKKVKKKERKRGREKKKKKKRGREKKKKKKRRREKKRKKKRRIFQELLVLDGLHLFCLSVCDVFFFLRFFFCKFHLIMEVPYFIVKTITQL